jgi:acyl carrier protein
MTRSELMSAVIEVMQEVMSEFDCTKFQDTEEPFNKMVDMDSMDFLDIVMALQKKYKIEIPDTDFGSLRNMKMTLDYLEAKIK